MKFILDIMPPCLFHHFTGLYCPGCGGTRAFIALIHGQFLKSLYYHPLILYVGACFIWYLLKAIMDKTFKGKINIPMPDPKAMIGFAAVIVIANWLVRNIIYLGWGRTFY